jgi:hypothetical protein
MAPDDAPLATLKLLTDAHVAPPHVLRAAVYLTRAALETGITSVDALFLVAMWAWPLRDVEPELSDTCWEYLIWAPWQTDALAMRELLKALHSLRALADGRSLMDLVRARRAAGLHSSARDLLEAAALVQARKRLVEEITSHRDFSPLPQLDEAHEAIVELSHLYEQRSEDQIWARSVMKRSVELTRSVHMIEVIESRVWDRPMDEAYAWSDRLSHPKQLDDELARALNASQPHHARRLCEAVLVRRFNSPWTSTPFDSVPGALEAFTKACAPHPPADPVARAAAEHLGVLYVRTRHATTHARAFVHTLCQHIAFTGAGASLHPMRRELELFYNQSDPYWVLRREADRLAALEPALSDDERAANDRVQRWFADRFRRENPTLLERLVAFMASPLLDVARQVTDIPALEHAVGRAVRVYYERGEQIAGDLGAIQRKGAIIRAKYGWGAHLMEFAREQARFEPAAAALISAGSSALPAHIQLVASAADLGACLLLAMRGIARISAAFGRDPFGPQGFGLLADTLALGVSSEAGEGLVAGLSHADREVLTNITVGTVAYGSAQLIEYLWTSPGAFRDKVSVHAVQRLARLIGLELSATATARVIPVVGAVVAGMSTYVFVKNILDAAIHVAARDALIERRETYSGGE